ncbi:suprabasin isoform X4 [Babesia caballi]|uniref:Suprabasin isoform X4 n=1 Tax=Babesia caballi TaxID=5871 RepID=A0AAV4LRN6_BABCB|nr:suprabasin isoform X4 [Babesia caballi]
MTTKKKLTEPPKDLKEAIDWLALIGGGYEEYFKKQANAQQINVAINNLKQKFEEFSQKPETPRADALNPNYYEDANKNIADLLKNVSEFEPKEAEKFGQGVHHAAGQAGKEREKTALGQSSPAAPVAATLTTFGLGGGAAAAYLFNLGGAKTLINGLLKIG